MNDTREWFLGVSKTNPTDVELFAHWHATAPDKYEQVKVREVLSRSDESLIGIPPAEWDRLKRCEQQLTKLREAAKHVLMVNSQDVRDYTYGLDYLRRTLSESEGDDE